MTATITETTTDLEILDQLDFEPAPPCEHSNHGKKRWHEGPGHIVFTQSPSPCGCHEGGKGEYVICKSAWEYAFASGLRCETCSRNFPRDEWWHFLGTVR